MLLKTPEIKASLVDRVLALVKRNFLPALLTGRFVVQYYGQVDADDLAERGVEDLGAALLFHFANKFTTGAPKVGSNPSLEEHGWRSTHTVIEIVNDDMPFWWTRSPWR